MHSSTAHANTLPGICRLLAWVLFWLAILTQAAHAGAGVWTQGLGIPASTTVYALTLDAGGNIYAGTSAGIYKSMDGGGIWAAASNGLTASNIRALALDASGNLYAGSDNSPAGGVYKSSDGAASWRLVSSGLSNPYVSTLMADAAGNVYAGTAGGVFKSGNGTSWIAVSNGLTGAAITINALTSDASGSVYAGTANGVYKSSNGGALWSAVYGGVANFVPSTSAIVADTSGHIFAAVAGVGVVKSSNGGSSWLAVNNGLTSAANHIAAFAIDPQGNVYAGSGFGVYQTSNGGSSWAAQNNGLSKLDIQALAISLQTGAVYAGGAGVFQYTPTTVSNKPFSITATSTGPATALRLNANISVASGDVGTLGNLYVVAYVPGVGAFTLSSTGGWAPLNIADIQPYTTTVLGTQNISILNGTADVSAFKGTVLFAGYGTSASDMLSNSKYAQIGLVE